MGIEIEGCEGITNIAPRREKRPQPVEHEPLDVTRRDTHSAVCLRAIARHHPTAPRRARPLAAAARSGSTADPSPKTACGSLFPPLAKESLSHCQGKRINEF